VTKNSLSAAALSLGLLATQASAQTSTTVDTTTQATGTASQTSDVSFRDGKQIIGASLSTTGGRYGTITDLVYDGTGAVRFALVEQNNQLHPVPFPLLQFGATGDVSIALSSATLDAITIDRNDLQTLGTRPFLAQLRAAFGPNVTRGFTNPAGIVPGTGNGNANPDSTAGQRSQLYSLSSLLGGTITGQGSEAGSISTVAISPDGRIAYAVGSTPTGNSRFAVPFAFATLTNGGNGLAVNATVQALTGVTLPTGALPTFSNQTFANSITRGFGDRATSLFASFGSTVRPSGIAVRDDVTDPAGRGTDANRSGQIAMARAGSPALNGTDAIARAGSPSLNGENAVARGGLASNTRTGATGTSDSTTTTGNNTVGSAGTTTGGATGTTTSGATGTSTDPSSTGGIVNMAPSVSSTSTLANNSGLIQLRDLMSFRVQAQDGAFGRVSDVVFDRNGNLMYLLGSYQGQTFPLPFTPSALSGTQGTLTYNVPMASLQQLALNPNDLPSLSNQAFLSRMRDVFGSSFGTGSMTTSSYGSTTGPTGATSGTTAGTTSGTFGTSGTQATVQGNLGTTGLRGPGTGSGTTTGSGTSTGTNTGTATGTGSDTWTWPTMGTTGTRGTTGTGSMPAPPPGSPFQNVMPPPGIKSKAPSGAGTGTSRMPAPPPGSNFDNSGPPPGVKSKSGSGNAGAGTGVRAVNPPRMTGRGGNSTGTNGTGGSSGTGTSGSGSSTSGSGSSGSGSVGGSGTGS